MESMFLLISGISSAPPVFNLWIPAFAGMTMAYTGCSQKTYSGLGVQRLCRLRINHVIPA